MRQDFRPTQEQLDYLNIDMIPFLEELGCDVNNNEYYIRSIDWYNWDDKPRWFVNIGIFNITDWKQAGYIEVDMKCEAYNGADYPMAIEIIKYAGHGFPCISTRIAKLDTESEQYIISKIDQ
jgi:hypothetical protein